MNRAIVMLTMRQLLGQRRTLLLGLCALLPLLIALVFRFSDSTEKPADWMATVLLAQFVVGTLLPLAALVFGTSALGAEVDDGTAVYLLARPLARSSIVLSKLAVAALATAAFVLVSAIIAASVAAIGEPGFGQALAAFAVAIVAASITYTALFVALSLLTTRAFVGGLVYVFLWEGLITRLFSGTRIFSVRQYSLGIAGQFAGLAKSVFDPKLSGGEAIVLAVVVTVGAAWLATWRLRRFEIGEAV